MKVLLTNLEHLGAQVYKCTQLDTKTLQALMQRPMEAKD